MDDLSVALNNSGIGGYIGDAFLNHLCYADDICLISLSSDNVVRYYIVYSMYGCVTFVTITITITNYLFRQNRTRNITKVILITHTKNINITTFVPRRLHLKTSWPLAYNHLPIYIGV